jgi:hypothetical protein
MKECLKIKKLLPLSILGDGLSLTEEEQVQRHLQDCAACRTELQELQALIRTTGEMNEDIDRVMDSVDWDRSRQQILSRIEWDRTHRTAPHRSSANRWTPRLGLVAASVLLVGILIGYLLFGPSERSHGVLTDRAEGESTYTVAVIEDNFKQKTIVDYFQQIRFLFLDLLEADRLTDLDPALSQSLLTHTRYLQNSIQNDYSLINVRELLEDIEFILVEIEQYQADPSSEMLGFIRDLIKNKRLLLKIHLISKDIRHIKNGV